MTCDHVFDILTRAPFPAGDASDVDVERHLGTCHECRQFAEALRPALDLFHESIPLHESVDLPGYMGALMAAVDETTTATAPRGRHDLPRPRDFGNQPPTRRAVKRGVVPSGFGLALGVLVCFGLLFTMARDASPTWKWRLSSSTAKADRAELSGAQLLASLNLPTICRDAFSADHPPIVDAPHPTPLAELGHRTRCCTECHSAANPQRPKLVSTVKLARSCAACHRSTDDRHPQQASRHDAHEIPSVASLADVGSHIAPRDHISDILDACRVRFATSPPGS